jgi:hypothetical protein
MDVQITTTGLQITVGHRTKVILIGPIQKKYCHIHFFAVTKSDCKFAQFAFCNKIYEAF